MAKKKPNPGGFPAWAGAGFHPDSVPASAGFQAVPPAKKRKLATDDMSHEQKRAMFNIWAHGSTEGPPPPSPMDQVITDAAERVGRNLDSAGITERMRERSARFGGAQSRILRAFQEEPPKQKPQASKDVDYEGEPLPADLDDEYWDEEEAPAY